MTRSATHLLATALVSVTLSTCSSPQPPSGEKGAAPAPSAGAQSTPAAKPEDDTPIPPTPSPYEALPDEARANLDRPFTGDLDAMIQRRMIRAGVVFNRTQYFIDKGVQRGISYESLKLFEDELNKRLKTGLLKVHVALIPMQRDQLGPALLNGKIDLVAATIIVTPERRKLADFSNPIRTNVSEIVVTAADEPPVATADDLSGREVFVRRSSIYHSDLEALNQSLTGRGKPPATIKEAPEPLEDDDVLEMVNAGIVKATIVDDFVADFWSKVFPNIRINKGAAVRSGAEIAVGIRKNSPKLLQAINTWIKEYGPGTAFGNTIEHRYLESTKYVKSAAAERERQKLLAMVKMFQTYGDRYNVDYLLMAAQGYQESALDQQAKSSVGAIGVMQLMPETGKEQGVGDIHETEANIHAGVKYFRFMMDTYYKDDPMDPLNKGLMTLASYNAGPGRMRQLRAETAKRGLNPNVWFGNVERVVSERIGRETVTYVANIYKYYVAYRLVTERRDARATAKDAVGK
jgi:membrane-bound lytic murein transglycosylase MltF